MFIFAFSFFNLFFRFRKNWWAILPGGLILSGGTAAAMDALLPNSQMSGPAFLMILASTFILVAIVSSKNWWAIIPGGTFTSIGLVVLLENFIPHGDFPAYSNTFKLGVYTWVLLLGLAITFGVLWLLRRYHPTTWAKYPAVGLLTVAILAFLLGSRITEIWWAALLLGVGAMIILSLLTGENLRRTSRSAT
jgi:hypothetical protein